MKKCICFLSLFVFIFLFNLSVNAEIYPEGNHGSYYNSQYYHCYYTNELNYLVGRDSIPTNDDYYIDANRVASYSGSPLNINFSGKFISTDSDDFVEFTGMLEFSGAKLQKISYYAEQDLAYQAVVQNDNSLKAVKNTPVDLNYYAGTRNKLFVLQKSDDYFSCNIDFEKYPTMRSVFNLIVIKTMYGYRVFENDKYQNKDLCFIVDSCNPLSEEAIISSLNVNDVTCGKISSSNIKIIDSDYDIVNNYVTPGDYNLTIKAWDGNGNITYQNCKIISADVTSPVIESINKKEAKANVLLSNDEILSCFNAVDEYSSVTVTIKDDDYSKNYQKVGFYDVSVIAKDEAGNEAYSKVTIEVVDNEDPVLTYTEAYITTDKPITEAELRGLITIYDEVDGFITDYDIHDNDDYFGHPNIQGEYEFEIEAYDEHGNGGCYNISLYVIDKDAPVIEAPKYTVILNKGDNVTREQILQILKASGQINSTANAKIYSAYFDSNISEGEYDLEIEEDGRIIHSIIKFVDKKDSNNKIDDDFYAIPIKKEENNNTYYIVFAISGGIIIILSILGVVIYKKKH